MKKINEDEFYESWRKYIDDINSLPVEVRRGFEWFTRYQEVMMLRRKFCDTLEKSRKA